MKNLIIRNYDSKHDLQNKMNTVFELSVHSVHILIATILVLLINEIRL